MPVEAPIAIDLPAILEPRGLKESDLVQVLGVSDRTVLFWRMNERKVSVENARRAEELLGIPKHLLRPDLWDPPPTSKRTKHRFRHRLTGEFQLTSNELAPASRAIRRREPTSASFDF